MGHFQHKADPKEARARAVTTDLSHYSPLLQAHAAVPDSTSDTNLHALKQQAPEQRLAFLGESWVLVGPPPQGPAAGWSFLTETAYLHVREDGRRFAYDDSYEVWLLRKKSAMSPHTLLIGRASSNDIVIDSPAVSKLHASVSIATSQLVDEGSHNGTSYNGGKLDAGQGCALEDGGVLQLGPHDFYTMSSASLRKLLTT